MLESTAELSCVNALVDQGAIQELRNILSRTTTSLPAPSDTTVVIGLVMSAVLTVPLAIVDNTELRMEEAASKQTKIHEKSRGGEKNSAGETKLSEKGASSTKAQRSTFSRLHEALLSATTFHTCLSVPGVLLCMAAFQQPDEGRQSSHFIDQELERLQPFLHKQSSFVTDSLAILLLGTFLAFAGLVLRQDLQDMEEGAAQEES